MFPSSPSMATQRQQSGSTTYDHTTPERDKISGVSSLLAPEDGGTFVGAYLYTFLHETRQEAAFQAEAGIKSEIDAV